MSTCDLASIVDDARELESDLGLRPYRIFSVYEWWPSGVRGRGEKHRKEVEWTPTPMLDFRSLRRRYRAAGSVESGDVVLRKVSASMTESEILRLCSCDEPDFTSTVVIEARQDGSCAARAFVMSGPPFLDAGRFEWIIPLKRASAIRSKR